MRLPKRLFALFLTILMLCIFNITTLADNVLDLSQNGSINIELRQGELLLSGGTLTLYRVGAVQELNGNYKFVLTNEFAGSEESLDDVESAQLAEKLNQYAKEHSLNGTTKEIGKDGKVAFDNLELGLYLLMQEKATDGYEKIAPFLVTVPIKENGSYLYDVDASPKIELKKADQPTPPTPSIPSTPSIPNLPQTGQLNWPIPVLVILGLGFFSVGWVLCFANKKN